MNASASSSSKSLKHGICPTTILQNTQLGSVFIIFSRTKQSSLAGDSVQAVTSIFRARQLSRLRESDPFFARRIASKFCSTFSYAIGLRSQLIILRGIIEQSCLHSSGCHPFGDPPGSCRLPPIKPLVRSGDSPPQATRSA